MGKRVLWLVSMVFACSIMLLVSTIDGAAQTPNFSSSTRT